MPPWLGSQSDNRLDATITPVIDAVAVAALQRERDEARGAMAALITELERVRAACGALADRWQAEDPAGGHADALRAALLQPDRSPSPNSRCAYPG